MSIDGSKEYNSFLAVDSATRVIVDYLMAHNEDLWKLLYYIEPYDLPLSKPNLTTAQKANMICTNPYDVDENVTKNVLFQIDTSEAFSTAIPQLRIEVGDILPIDPYLSSMEINFQIVVPNKQDIFTAPYNQVARRSLAIFRELAKTLNGKYITNSNFHGPMFLDRQAKNGTGRKTGSYVAQMNRDYAGRWCTFAVLMASSNN